MKRPAWRPAAGPALFLLIGLAAPAASPANQAETRGQAEIAIRGYYQGSNSQPLVDTTGLAFRFQHFIPKVGLLSGSLESYGQQRRFRTGDNFLELQGLTWGGFRWTLAGGDFRTSATTVDFPFYNVYFPQISARGLKLEAAQGGRRYTFFAGSETLLEGPRVPYRVRVPQDIFGVSVQQKFGERLQLGARVLRLTSNSRSIEENRFFFPLSRDFQTAHQASIQSLLSVAKRLRLYSEASASAVERRQSSWRGSDVPVSALVGSVWDSPRLTARVNYSYQGTSYLPVLGYFLGDRKGPFGELHLRPSRRLGLYGSASQYTNNLEKDPRVPTFRSSNASAGASLSLPWRFSLNGQLSTIRLISSATDTAVRQDSNNRMTIVSLARPIHRHTVRLAVREILTRSNLRLERQRSAEVEDVFHWKRLVLGGAARLQRAVSEQRQNTVFVRGLAQLRIWRINGYGNFENASDLVNRTLFATNAFSTTVVGMNVSLGSGWNFQAEAFRNRLTSELNPESIFVFGTRGVGVPTVLSRLNQWSLLVGLHKQLSWGGGLPPAAMDEYVREQIPLVGTVEGFVFERRTSGNYPAEGVAVTLDHVQTAVTDSMGRYRFTEVPEGGHKVILVERELPAEYNPGPATEVMAFVKPKQIARVDLDVIRLIGFQGRLVAPDGVALESVVVRLLPAGRYTTPDPEGHFYFQNLPEGDYEVTIETGTVPRGAELVDAGPAQVTLRHDSGPPAVEFRLKAVQQQPKPIRRVFEQAPGETSRQR